MAYAEVNQDELMRLLRSVARKDRKAFQELYSKVAARMFGLCIKLANHRELAEEAMQESFIQIWHHAGEYHRDRGAPLGWMMTIARYRTLDLMRARKVRQTTGDVVDLWMTPCGSPGRPSSRGALKSSVMFSVTAFCSPTTGVLLTMSCRKP